MSSFRVKTVLTSDGERLPMLIGSDGSPVWAATVFVLTELRARNRAASTIENTLRALMIFHVFLEQRGINLEQRMSSGRILSLDEIEDLVRICRLPAKDIGDVGSEDGISELHCSTMSLERYRSRGIVQGRKEIVPAFSATRLRCIRGYLKWMAVNRMSRLDGRSEIRSALDAATRFLVEGVEARLPPADSRGVFLRREGLEPDVVSELLRVIQSDSPDNPWQDEHSRHRNELIVLWLYYLGLRRGELLGVRVSDIDFIKGTVIIVRRADDKDDPRRRQPNAKTRAREIPIAADLLEKTSNYIIAYRANLSGARKHSFLFVTSDTGWPMSISAFSKIFAVLREKCKNLPHNLFAHLLRHTWNDRFSDEMDQRGVSEETEKKLRSYLMGWSETSGSAATYTRRHIRKKAEQASLSMQAEILNGEAK
jgi:integrase